ncbi:MAG TPA: DUF5995 family protein [Gaiellaceae bacterium]|nr:DUF5995 family protein [Gaiellaceae bacterium]
MRAAALAAAGVLVCLVSAGCGGGDDGGGAAATSDDADWVDIVATLSPGLDAGSANPCGRGDRACVTAVVDEMGTRLDRLAADCDHDAPFAFMYREVTRAVEEADDGFFTDRASLAHLDAVFADLYFRAYDAWHAGRRDAVPAAWRIAFEAADGRRVSGIGDLLLGMNAHISRDLPFALAAIAEAGPSTGEHDFELVDDLLAGIQGQVLDEAARRFDGTIDDFSIPELDVDDATVAQLIASWRHEAWLNGERLAAAADEGERAAVAASIETQAAARALLIRTATHYVPFLTSTAPRDRHCAAAPSRP